uniref:Uncharacterized protein n=1 Tax=Anguilla anguilla TaxID=7936 RepID=A0A0E9VUT1_ANGAN
MSLLSLTPFNCYSSPNAIKSVPSPSLLTFPTRQYMDCMDLSHPFLSIDRSCILPITFTVNSVSPKLHVSCTRSNDSFCTAYNTHSNLSQR